MNTKKCPFCGEEIQAEAIKCRYCREFLEASPQIPKYTVPEMAPQVQPKKTEPAKPVEPAKLVEPTKPVEFVEQNKSDKLVSDLTEEAAPPAVPEIHVSQPKFAYIGQLFALFGVTVMPIFGAIGAILGGVALTETNVKENGFGGQKIKTEALKAIIVGILPLLWIPFLGSISFKLAIENLFYPIIPVALLKEPACWELLMPRLGIIAAFLVFVRMYQYIGLKRDECVDLLLICIFASRMIGPFFGFLEINFFHFFANVDIEANETFLQFMNGKDFWLLIVNEITTGIPCNYSAVTLMNDRGAWAAYTGFAGASSFAGMVIFALSSTIYIFAKRRSFFKFLDAWTIKMLVADIFIFAGMIFHGYLAYKSLNNSHTYHEIGAWSFWGKPQGFYPIAIIVHLGLLVGLYYGFKHIRWRGSLYAAYGIIRLATVLIISKIYYGTVMQLVWPSHFGMEYALIYGEPFMNLSIQVLCSAVIFILICVCCTWRPEKKAGPHGSGKLT